MAEKKTITLTWTKAETMLIARVASQCLAKQPVMLSAAMEKYACPTCYSDVIKDVTNYCNECGQALDWEAEEHWENEVPGLKTALANAHST